MTRGDCLQPRIWGTLALAPESPLVPFSLRPIENDDRGKSNRSVFFSRWPIRMRIAQRVRSGERHRLVSPAPTFKVPSSGIGQVCRLGFARCGARRSLWHGWRKLGFWLRRRRRPPRVRRRSRRQCPPRAPMREAERRGGGGAGGVVGFVFLQRCVGADVGDHVGPTCGQWVGL